MKNILNTSYKILKNPREFSFYFLIFIFIIPVGVILFAKKIDYVSIYCLIFIIINFYTIILFSKKRVKIGLLFSLLIAVLYSLNILSFLFYYDDIPKLNDDIVSESIFKASHLFIRTLFERIVEHNSIIIHNLFLFLIFSYVIISISIFYFEKKFNLNFNNQVSENEKKEEIKIYFVNIILFIILSFLFLFFFNKEYIKYNSLTAILSAILRIDNFIILIISFYFFFKDALNKRSQIILVITIIFLFFSYIYLTKSKALILLIALVYLSNIILSNNKIRVSILNCLIIIFLFCITFFIATFLKNYNPTNIILLFRENGFSTFIFTGLIGRLSYFEFFAEKVINISFYIDFINFNYYFKVIIDKLTPGFDIYNVGFASRELYKSYYDLSDPNILNSEQITIFAEAFMLFKYYSIFYYIFICLILILSLIYFSKKINYLNFLVMNYILYIFVNWILGIGLDQLFIKIELLTIFIILFIIFNKLINKLKPL